jgi:AraC-like DNA-binding protein
MTPAKTATQIDRPERLQVEVSDPAEMHEFLERAYGAKVRLCNRDSVRGDRPSLIHMRTDVGPFAIEEVQLRGDIEASTDPINKVVGVWVTAGRAVGHSDGITGSATPGEVTMVAQPDMPNYTHTQDVCQISVLMDPSVVASVATGTPASKASLPIRFMSFQPVNAASAQRCKDTLRYVKDVVLADDTIATPLVLGHVSRLLAAVALSTFPNSATTGPTPHDRADHRPVLLRRASEFIDANVIEDIGLDDIAEAVHVTARAVQYMFRRHLDTTPLRYLREVRLHYAHEGLLIANRRQDTVTAIVARWGFMHTGRFRGLLPANLRPQPAHHAARLTWLVQLRGGAGLANRA